MCKYDQDTPEIARVTTAPFWTRWQELAYSTKYLINYYTYLHQTYIISSHTYGDYKTDVSLVVVEVTLLC